MFSLFVIFFILFLLVYVLYLSLRINKLENEISSHDKSFKDKILIDSILSAHFENSISELNKNSSELTKDILSISENFLKFQKDIQAFIELVIEFTNTINKESEQKNKSSKDFFELKSNKKEPPKSN